MKLIKPNVEILEQGPGLQGIYEAICQAAATCYKSEAKTGESAKAFVERLIKNKHYAMLEFGTVYLSFPDDTDFVKWIENPYSVIVRIEEGFAVTTNYRVIVENNWIEDLQYICEPTKPHPKRYTAKFTISIGTGREFLRHRTFSFANESTRYINYTKENKGGEVTYILPSWVRNIDSKAPEYHSKNASAQALERVCSIAEQNYRYMIDSGCTPQEAREVLPLCTKSELCMCGFEKDWTHFFDLRMRGTTGKPHPDAYEAVSMLWEKFKNKEITL